MLTTYASCQIIPSENVRLANSDLQFGLNDTPLEAPGDIFRDSGDGKNVKTDEFTCR